MSHSRKNPPEHAANNDDPANDYEYFKQPWTQKMHPDSKPEVTAASHSRPKKKMRKTRVEDQHQSAAAAGPIQNMEFVMDQKEDNSVNNDNEGKKHSGLVKSKPDTRITANGIKVRQRYHQHLLYQHFSVAEIDNLVGWATSHRGNTSESNVQRSNALENEERRLGLSHMPTAPPPPSHIAFLQKHISERSNASSTGAAKEEYALAADAAAYEGNKDTTTTSKPLHHEINVNSMDTSAYVAVGISVEEALIMALIPLAEAHVARCRRLEK